MYNEEAIKEIRKPIFERFREKMESTDPRFVVAVPHYMAKRVVELVDELRGKVENGNWTSIENGMPPEFDQVIGVDEYERIHYGIRFIADYRTGDGKRFKDVFVNAQGVVVFNIFYWMPELKAPKIVR